MLLLYRCQHKRRITGKNLCHLTASALVQHIVSNKHLLSMGGKVVDGVVVVDGALEVDITVIVSAVTMAK